EIDQAEAFLFAREHKEVAGLELLRQPCLFDKTEELHRSAHPVRMSQRLQPRLVVACAGNAQARVRKRAADEGEGGDEVVHAFVSVGGTEPGDRKEAMSVRSRRCGRDAEI